MSDKHVDPAESKKVETFFHGYAEDFDSIYGHTKKRSAWDKMLDNMFRGSMNARFEHTFKHSAKDEIKTVLDVGCGPGHYCDAFLRQGKTVVGLDIAEGMLKLAREKTKEFSAEQISYVLAGYLDHDFGTKFDAACLTGFFDYIKEPLDVFAKLNKETSKEIYMSFPKKGGFLAWQRKVRYNMRNCPLYYYSLKDLQGILDKAGWNGKYDIVDLDRDFFVLVTL